MTDPDRIEHGGPGERNVPRTISRSRALNDPEDQAVFAFGSAGVRLIGERWHGDDDGLPTVVLLHGGGQTRHSWGVTAMRLAGSGWPVVALDGRGHGDSGWDPAGDYSLDAFAEDLLTFLHGLGGTAVLVGASLGGITALVVASEHPELVRALVLVDVVVELEAAGVDRIRQFMTSNAEGFESLEEVADAIVAYNPLRKRPRNLDGLRKNLRRGNDDRWHWHWDPAFMHNDDEPRRHTDPQRLASAAAKLTVPTLIVRGAESDVVSSSGIEDMRRRLPTAQVVDVAAAGHMVAGDDNDVFGTELEAFLASLV